MAIPVALKRLRRDDGTRRDLYLEGARIAARIIHPNVAVVFDAGVHGGELFFVTEYVDGKSLRVLTHRLAQQGLAMPPALAARIVADALAGLHAAHEVRDASGRSVHLVHGDVSPGTLHVTYQGRTKVLDVGLMPGSSAGATAETQAHFVTGKVAYRAPEQAVGDPVDRRADVFSAGVVLWELVTGRSLLGGRSPAETLARLLHEPLPPLSSMVPGVDAQLDAAVTRALARDPDGRFPTAAEMQLALEGYLARAGGGSEADVAQMLGMLFGPQREAELALVRSHLASVNVAALSSLPPMDMRDTGSAMARTHRPDEPRRRPRLVLLAVALGGAAVFAGLGLAAVIQRPTLTSPSLASTAAVTPRAPVLPAPPVAAAIDNAQAPATPATPPPTEPAPVAASTPATSAPMASHGVVEARPRSTRPLASRPNPRVAAAPVARPRSPKSPATTPSSAPAATASQGTGYLTLDTYPWTRVSFQGRVLGVTPLVRVELPAGTHSLEVENVEQGIHQTVTVTVPRGDVVSKRMAYR